MKRSLTVVVAAGALILMVSAAKAHWGSAYGPGMGGRMGPGMMGSDGQGYHGVTGCPGWEATSTPQITEEKAKGMAQKYADQYRTGFKIERVLPFAGMHHTMYSVELKNPEGDLRTLHINPFGNVMPFGGPWSSGS